MNAMDGLSKWRRTRPKCAGRNAMGETEPIARAQRLYVKQVSLLRDTATGSKFDRMDKRRRKHRRYDGRMNDLLETDLHLRPESRNRFASMQRNRLL